MRGSFPDSSLSLSPGSNQEQHRAKDVFYFGHRIREKASIHTEELQVRKLAKTPELRKRPFALSGRNLRQLAQFSRRYRLGD
jgi:hypothetical protein